MSVSLTPTDPEYIELIDAGKRISDEYAMHRLADPIGNIGQFMAIRLQDGISDHALYPSRDAGRRVISKHDDEDRWFFIQIVPSTLSVQDAAMLFRANRKLYGTGARSRTMGGRVMIPRVSREDMTSQLRSIFRGTEPSNRRDVQGN